jgi:hypothetical protein
MPRFSPNRKFNLLFTRSLDQKMFAISVPLLILLLSSTCLAQNSDHMFVILDQSDGSRTHQLSISITQTLYEYYLDKDHLLSHNYDLSKFVTPDPLEPVASELWSICSNEEDFVNSILMITHQIPYKESGPQKFPIETIVENEGDCDLFSFLAASIIKAGGIDVVLLLYEEEEHMALGVNLSNKPNEARTDIFYISFEEKRYYIAECTGNLEGGWRVGECPDIIQGAEARIIPLDDMELFAPDNVSCSFSTPQSASLFLSVSKNFLMGEENVQILGSLSPVLEGENVTLYVSSYGSSLAYLATVRTDSNGRYFYNWNSPPGGVYSIRANWSGNVEYVGSDSDASQVVVIPFTWLMMGAIVFFFLIVLLIVSLATRRNRTQTVQEFEE